MADSDPIAVLLRELGQARKDLTYTRERLLKVTKARDRWREEAAVQSARRREYMREYMRARRANG